MLSSLSAIEQASLSPSPLHDRRLEAASFPGRSESGEPSLQSARDEFRRIIIPKLPLYQTLAQKGGFWIEFGEKTCWDHERRTIVLNIDDFVGKGMNLTPSMVDYLIMHELGHMKELYDDPSGYSDIIDTGLENYGAAAFRLYNCLMDVYVNSNTAQVAPVYGSSRHASKEVESFYRDQAFLNRDFSGAPHALQFAHYLLNLGMGVGGDVKLSPEVQERIDRGLVDFTGHKVGYREFLDTYMRPAAESNRTDMWRGVISQRKRVIDRLIRPDFEKYLQSDIAAGRAIVVPQILGVGSLLPGTALKGILKDAERVKSEGKPTVADREMDRQLRQIGKELEMPVEQVNEFITVFQKMMPTINKLAKVWDELQFIGVQRGVGKEGYYARGVDLDMQRVISQYPSVIKSPEDAQVMYRRVPFDDRVPVPRHFNLRLILDTSGSMKVIERQVREAAVALGASLYVKNKEAALKNDCITCGLEVHRFSGQSQVVLPCTEKLGIRELMKWFPQIKMGGGTADHFALQSINRSIDRSATEKIQSGERVEITIEITDGDTCDPAQTVRELRQLENKGVLVGAIDLANRPEGGGGRGLYDHFEQKLEELQEQLEMIPEEEAATRRNMELSIKRIMAMAARYDLNFDQIWNGSGQKKGLHIGDPQQLPVALSEMISRFIAESPALRDVS